MGCQSTVTIGNNLTFTITTHDPDTGILTDADAAPTYRVYEDETAVAIATGNMATLDAANTTGFYSELIACTTANGFEVGKSYNIYIEATVDGDTGGISCGFAVENVIAQAVTAILPTSPSTGNITVVRGDTTVASISDLGNIVGRTTLWLTVKTAHPLTDAQCTLQVTEAAGLTYLNAVAAGVAPLPQAAWASLVVTDAVLGDVTVTIDENATKDLVPRSYYFDIQVLNAGTVTTLTTGYFLVVADVTRAIV